MPQKIKENISKGIKKYNEEHGIFKKEKIQKRRNKKQKYCKVCGNVIKETFNSKQYCSDECRHIFLSQHTGGYRLGSGRGKQGWYHGVHCDSTWELAFLIYHLDHNIDIQRCKEPREYVYNNEKHQYYPDFIVDDKIYEIKGYKSDISESKHIQNPDVIVLYKNEMKPYIDYVKKKYEVREIYELYDRYNPKKDIQNQEYVFVHKNGMNTMIKVDKFQEYLDNGWKRGRINK